MHQDIQHEVRESRAVIASLEMEGASERHDENDDENGDRNGNDDNTASAASESESASLFSGASSFDSHSFDGAAGIMLDVEGLQTSSSALSSRSRGAVSSSRNSKSLVDKEEQYYDEGDDDDDESWDDYPSIGSGLGGQEGRANAQMGQCGRGCKVTNGGTGCGG